MGILETIRKSRSANGAAADEEPAAPPTKILVIDIGGSKMKILATGHTQPRKAYSGKKLTPTRMVETVKRLAHGWQYEAVSIGYPGLVGRHGPRSEPENLGSGWVGFNFAAALERPVRIINDAAMQALGSYEGGRMLFLGLGTGLGSALIAENVIVPLELGALPHVDGAEIGLMLGKRGLDKLGKEKWRELVEKTVKSLTAAFVPDYVVIGGGNAKKLKTLPHGARRGNNLTAFRGGYRLWNLESVPTHSADGDQPAPAEPVPASDWRVI